jgi:hypothetical protein
MTPSDYSHQLPSPEHKELHPRILPAEYFGKGEKIFCSRPPHTTDKNSYKVLKDMHKDKEISEAMWFPSTRV